MGRRRALRGICCRKDSVKVKANVGARKRREGEGNMTEKHQNHSLSFAPLLRAGSATQLLKCATKWASSSSQLLLLHPSPHPPSTPAISLQQSLCMRTLWGGPADALPGFHSGRVEGSSPPHVLPHYLMNCLSTPSPQFHLSAPSQINVIHLQNTNGDPWALTQSFLLVLFSYSFYNYICFSVSTGFASMDSTKR